MSRAMTTLCAVAAGLVATVASRVRAEPPPPRIGSAQPPPALQVPLECSGAGASDVSSRHHSIKNTTGHTVPKGTVIQWSASDKGSAAIKLTADLAAGASIDVIQPGQTSGYTCIAGFRPGEADLAVKSVKWTDPSTATIEVENVYPWTDAKPSTLHLTAMRCLATPVLAKDVAVPAIARGKSVTVTASIAHAGADYLKATANSTNTVPEANKANNTMVSPEFGSNKSCTPQ